MILNQNIAINIYIFYTLPPPESILDAPPKKTCWKNLVKNATSNYWYKEWFKDKKEKSSIQYLQLQNNPIHNPHNIWKVVNHRSKDVKKAQVKAKLITNTYSLQSLRAKYNQHAVKPTCVICNEGDEDIEHFILKCKGLNTTRMVYLEKLQSLIDSIKGGGYQRLEEEGLILQLVLDVTSENIHGSIDISKEHIINIERITQSLCFVLNSERANKINSG